MRTKIFLFTSLVAMSLLTWEVKGMTDMTNLSEPTPIYNGDVGDPPSGYDKIDLKGDLMFNIGPNAVVAGASDDAVYIGFNEDCGNVSISIYSGIGNLVYSTVVNSGMQPVVIIPFSGFASGIYTVELNSSNGYADGDFEHE